jgi:hypothetical protein
MALEDPRLMPVPATVERFPDATEQARRFADLVELQLVSRGYLSRSGELTLLERGVADFGLSLTEARGILAGAADRRDVALGRQLEKGVEEWVKMAAGRRKKLSRRQFSQAVRTLQASASGELEPGEAERRVKSLMMKHEIMPKRSGLFRTRRWYNKIQ